MKILPICVIFDDQMIIDRFTKKYNRQIASGYSPLQMVSTYER